MNTIKRSQALAIYIAFVCIRDETFVVSAKNTPHQSFVLAGLLNEWLDTQDAMLYKYTSSNSDLMLRALTPIRPIVCKTDYDWYYHVIRQAEFFP